MFQQLPISLLEQGKYDSLILQNQDMELDMLVELIYNKCIKDDSKVSIDLVERRIRRFRNSAK